MTTERRSMWVYPWDVEEVGVDALPIQARDEWGLTSLSVTMSYHNAKFLRPRAASKVFLSGGSAVYFEPDPGMYRDAPIQPFRTPRTGLLTTFDRTAEACRRAGLEIRAWVVTLHNSRLGELHPELTEENVYGDRYPWALCPSNPGVRAYAVGLLRDVVVNHGPDAIDLESIGFHGLQHGHHHELTGIIWGPVEEFLMSLCFCDSCRARAAERGIDADLLRRDIRALLDARFAEEARLPSPDPGDMRSVLSFLLSWPELHAYIRMRMETVASLVELVKREAIGSAATKLAVAAATFVKPASNAWQEGTDLRAVSQIADEVILVSYFHDPAAIAADLQFGREITGDVSRILVGFSLLHPLTTTAANLRAKVETARAMGASSFSFYNYGFVSAERLGWLRALAD